MPDDGRPALPDIDCIRGFAGASPMAVAVLQGPAHRIRYVNPAFLAATGRAEQALLNCRMAEAFPELGEAPLAALDRVHGTGEPCRAEAIALALGPHSPSFAPRLWDAEVSAVRGGGGAIAGVLVLLRDVTAREAQSARYRALVEAGSLAVWIAGPDGALAEAPSWDELTGQTRCGIASASVRKRSSLARSACSARRRASISVLAPIHSRMRPSASRRGTARAAVQRQPPSGRRRRYSTS